MRRARGNSAERKTGRRGNEVRTYLVDATEVASDIVERAREALRVGFLEREALENFKVAATILMKARELQIELKKVQLNPAVKTLVINNTTRQLAEIPDEELKKLAAAMLASPKE